MTAKLLTSLTMRHLDLLEQRGIDPELLVRLGVVSCDRNDGDWIAIPYRSAGKIVNYKYRTISGQKRFHQDAGAPKIFWNQDVLLDRSLDGLPLIITEGEFDAMIAMQCGYQRVVSVPDGAPAQEVGDREDSAKYQFVHNAEGLLAMAREIILAVDGDEAGQNLRNDLAMRLGKVRCRYVRYPKDCKDLNDAFMRYQARGVGLSLQKAEWCKVDGVFRMGDLPPLPERPALPLGMPVLDNHLRLRKQDFIVVTGIPSHGKSSFLNEIACRAVQNLKWRVAFASFEQAPQLDHKRNLRTYFHRKRVKWQSSAELEVADRWINDNFAFICPSDEELVTLQWTLEKATAAVVRHNVDMVVIDPWNEMDHMRPDGMSLTEYTGFAIKEFKRFARRYDALVVVAAHPAKLQKDKAGAYAIPTLYDISDSAHWYNKADVGIIVHRDTTGTLIRVAKARYQDITGEVGDVEVSFDPESNHYTPTDTQGAMSI